MKIMVIKNDTKNIGSMGEIKPELIEMIRSKTNEEIFVVGDNEEEVSKYIQEVEAIITFDNKNIDISLAKNLKWIHFCSAGTDDKITEDIKNSDIIITNSSGVHPIPISEHVIMFILMFSKGMHREMSFSNRNYDELQIQELTGKTVCIVGLGRIGSKIAETCKYFNMNVYGVSRKSKSNFEDKHFNIDEIDSAIKDADFVVVALPLNDSTFKLFNYERFCKMKESSYFINIGRGHIVDENGLKKALSENKISGAGLDVFEVEPLSEDSELLKMKNVITTPHISGWTPKYMERVFKIFIENYDCFISNKEMPNRV